MNLYRQGKVPGSFYDGFGQEAVSVGAAWAMAATDRLCVLHRDLGAPPRPRRRARRGSSASTWAAPPASRAAATATCTSATYKTGCVGMVSMLPDMMVVATGMAMAFKLRREARCALTWFGDGSTSRGDFHEAMNWAGVQHLPVIFILENNQYAYSTPIDLQFAINPVQRAEGYGFPGISVDGNDVEAMFEATRAGARARDRRRRPDAHRGRHDAHARPRRARRHEVRPEGARRGVAQEGPDRSPERARRRARRRRRRAARGGQGRGRRRRRGRRSPARCPTPRHGDRPTSFIRATRRRSCSRTAPPRGAGTAHERDDLPARRSPTACARRCAATSAC